MELILRDIQCFKLIESLRYGKVINRISKITDISYYIKKLLGDKNKEDNIKYCSCASVKYWEFKHPNFAQGLQRIKDEYFGYSS